MQPLPEKVLHQLNNWDNPIALEGEKILFVQRKHWITILPHIISLVIITLTGTAGAIIALFFLFHDYIFPVIVALLLDSISFTILVKVITEWYFSVYVLTNRRLLEITYTPLTSYVLNDVLLDQVRCTEIDTTTQGFIHKYFDIGDIFITFDRPTHRESFAMYSIKDFHKLSRVLCHWLLPAQNQNYQPAPIQIPIKNIPPQTIWYKDPKIPHKFSNITEIIPRRPVLLNPRQL